jgi:DNA-binding beta-propeller fold protein YncE
MKATLFILKRIFLFVLFLMAFGVKAGTPLWTLTPLTATTLSIPASSSVTVQYQVTNQANLTHALSMQTITGVTQLTNGAGICPNPFVLGPKASCVLSLQIDGSALSKPIADGPVICQQGSQLQCYRPAANNNLHITQAVSTLKMAYIANSFINSISICTVLPDGSFDACASYSDPTFNYPVDIILNSSKTIAYVENVNGASISICTVNPNGFLGNCQISATTLPGNFGGRLEISGMTIKNNILYLTMNDSLAYVTVCPLNQDGSIGNCNQQASSCSLYSGRVGFDSLGQHIYIADAGDQVVQSCNVSINGSITNCSANVLSNAPLGIATNNDGTVLYVPNSGNAISLFTIGLNGALSYTSDTNPLFNFSGASTFPINLFYGSSALISVPNPQSNVVSSCSDDFMCTIITSSTFSAPTSVWIAQF